MFTTDSPVALPRDAVAVRAARRQVSSAAVTATGMRPAGRWRLRRIVGAALALAAIVFLAVYGGYLAGSRTNHADVAAASGAWPDHPQDLKVAGQNAWPGVTLVKDKPQTVAVPDVVRRSLGILVGAEERIGVAHKPAEMPPLVLPGSTALDPIRLARVRARFAPARVVQIGKVYDYAGRGQIEGRELRTGDRVHQGDVLGVFYSVDVGSKKNDLLDALTQLELDQQILDNAEKHAEAVPQVFLLGAQRQVQTDRNQVDRALHNLEAWDIPQDEIDALRDEARKQAADKHAWLQTREGRWVKGEKAKSTDADKINPERNAENPWGRVTLRAPFDGVIVERNVHVDEMVVDNTVNLFQIAQVKKLLVVANCPEDQLPTLESLPPSARQWSVAMAGSDAPLSGSIDEVGYLIDPNQHTAIIKGYVENPGEHLRAGQFVSATVAIPPPPGVVELPATAVMEDGQQSLVFVQADPAKAEYTMRRVQITHRFAGRVFVRSTPLPEDERLTQREAEEGCLPKEPLASGTRVLLTGTGELHTALQALQAESKEAELADARQ